MLTKTHELTVLLPFPYTPERGWSNPESKSIHAKTLYFKTHTKIVGPEKSPLEADKSKTESTRSSKSSNMRKMTRN